MQLTILHTNDIHDHVTSWLGWEGDLKGHTMGGSDRLATAVERVRKEADNVLLLDAGDVIGDTLMASSTTGKAIIDLMNLVGYDAMTIGNHEPDFVMDTLWQRIQLFADVIRQDAKADITLLPGVGCGVAIPAGPVDRDALKNMVPHESKDSARVRSSRRNMTVWGTRSGSGRESVRLILDGSGASRTNSPNSQRRISRYGL